MNPMTPRKIALALSILTSFALQLDAAETALIPEIGAHLPILTVEKNVHPENRMIVYTKVDANGRFVAAPDNPSQPLLDFYWLMDGKTYKPVNPLIKIEIRKRLEVQAPLVAGATHFAININDLKEVRSDINQPKVDVSLRGTPESREVEAQMNLGPSNGNMRIKVSSIHTEGRAFPPAVYSVTLNGEEIANGKPTGKKITRKYDAASSSN